MGLDFALLYFGPSIIAAISIFAVHDCSHGIAEALPVKFTKTPMTKMAHDGYARAINPVHTMADGDTIFLSRLRRPRVAAAVKCRTNPLPS